MKAYVAVTDNHFWQPSGNRVFKALEVGQPFLFKLHRPESFIVGGGYFTRAWLLESSLAWKAFGEKNGAASLDEMRHRIERYRRSPPNRHQDYKIGCIILTDPFFFDGQHWIVVPGDFHQNIVQGKIYDLSTPMGSTLWRDSLDVLQGRQAMDPEGAAEGVAYGEPILVRPRLGQGAFRVLVTETYQHRCAVTREKALPVREWHADVILRR